MENEKIENEDLITLGETEFKKEGKFRGWIITINNWTSNDWFSFEKPKIKKQLQYYVVGKEVGELNKVRHLQIFIYYHNNKTLKEVNGHFRGHKIVARAYFDASNYCKKGTQPKSEWRSFKHLGENWGRDADFVEYGEIPTQEQGKRNDLDFLKNEIINGDKKVDEICEDNPMMFHKYGRTLERLENISYRKSWRTERTLGYWIWGESGLGKTHIAKKNYHPSTHYKWEFNDNGWQDNYQQQPIVILEEFRGQMKYSELLEMIDDNPFYNVSRRCNKPIPFTSKVVIITSSLPPEDVYNNLASKDKLTQLFRRIEVINITNENRDEIHSRNLYNF